MKVLSLPRCGDDDELAAVPDHRAAGRAGGDENAERIEGDAVRVDARAVKIAGPRAAIEPDGEADVAVRCDAQRLLISGSGAEDALGDGLFGDGRGRKRSGSGALSN